MNRLFASLLALALAGPALAQSIDLYQPEIPGPTGPSGPSGPSGPIGPGLTDCAGDATATAGPLFVQSSADCTSCSTAGAGDLVVGGGDILGQSLTNALRACTSDASDTSSWSIGGGGAVLGTRGAWGKWSGNENASTPGAFQIETGNVAGSVGALTSRNATGGLTWTHDDGTEFNALQMSAAGLAYGSTLNHPFFLDAGEDILLEGDTADAFETTLGAAPGLAADTIFRTPATNGTSGFPLVTDGAGQGSWSARLGAGAGGTGISTAASTGIPRIDAGVWSAAELSGDGTTSGSNVLTIANNAISNAKLRDSGALSVIGRSANSSGDPADIAAVAGSDSVLRESGSTVGFGTIASGGLANDAVTFAKMQNIATDSLIGRDTASTGDPENILLNATLSMDGSGNLQRAALSGDVAASAGSNTTAIGNDKVTSAMVAFNYAASASEGGAATDLSCTTCVDATDIAANAVTFPKLLNATAQKVAIGRNTAGPGNFEEVTVSQMLDWAGSSSQGAVLYRDASTWGVLAPGTSGQFLKTNGAAANPSFANVTGAFIGQTVLTAGTTFTTNANAITIVVELVGGGGGGGGSTSTASNAGAGGGGAAGAYARKQFTVAGSTGYTYAIAAGGTAGSNAGGTGGTGGDTTFTVGGTTVTAKGGLGGVGMTAAATPLIAAGGAGVIATSGDLNGTGAAGAYGTRVSGTVGGSGSGGSSPWGGGGIGITTGGAGTTPTGYGGGGGGALVLNNSGAVAGGVGAPGAIIVSEYR